MAPLVWHSNRRRVPLHATLGLATVIGTAGVSSDRSDQGLIPGISNGATAAPIIVIKMRMAGALRATEHFTLLA
jgi:hypothetical protein